MCFEIAKVEKLQSQCLFFFCALLLFFASQVASEYSHAPCIWVWSHKIFMELKGFCHLVMSLNNALHICGDAGVNKLTVAPVTFLCTIRYSTGYLIIIMLLLGVFSMLYFLTLFYSVFFLLIRKGYCKTLCCVMLAAASYMSCLMHFLIASFSRVLLLCCFVQ